MSKAKNFARPVFKILLPMLIKVSVLIDLFGVKEFKLHMLFFIGSRRLVF